ncbi:MAG: DUF6537 domain-containing protein, partial [Alphaproteobacteria bacterium]
VRPPAALVELPEPTPAAIPEGGAYGILVTGVGGTGVVTIGALLGMAAHLEAKGCSIVDQLGMAQKGGAVVSHIQIARRPEDVRAARLGPGGAQLLLGCDMLVAAGDLALGTVAPGTTRAVINTHESITGHFTRSPDLEFPTSTVLERITDAVGRDRLDVVEATRIATGLMGDSIATNLFVLGYAYQKGLIPVSGEAIERAVELNAVAVEMNKQTFAWGRRAALDADAVENLARPPAVARQRPLSRTLDELVARRNEELTAYQGVAYARRYEALVRRAEHAERERAKGMTGLALAVARYYYKLLAYKDEYEVARLYSDGRYMEQLKEQFEGDYKLRFHLAPPLFAPRDPETGQLTKRGYGAWMFTAFKALARLRVLRGTPLDPFGYSTERRRERALIRDYESAIEELIRALSHDNHALAVEIASVPERIRGYGHVKDRHLVEAERCKSELLAAFRTPKQEAAAAE